MNTVPRHVMPHALLMLTCENIDLSGLCGIMTLECHNIFCGATCHANAYVQQYLHPSIWCTWHHGTGVTIFILYAAMSSAVPHTLLMQTCDYLHTSIWCMWHHGTGVAILSQMPQCHVRCHTPCENIGTHLSAVRGTVSRSSFRVSPCYQRCHMPC